MRPAALRRAARRRTAAIASGLAEPAIGPRSRVPGLDAWRELGDFDEAWRCGRGGVRGCAERPSVQTGVARVQHRRHCVALERGDVEQARAAARTRPAICSGADSRSHHRLDRWRRSGAAHAGWTGASTGVPLLEEALAIARIERVHVRGSALGDAGSARRTWRSAGSRRTRAWPTRGPRRRRRPAERGHQAYALRAARRDRGDAASRRTSTRPRHATARRWPWPKSWRCARSRPAATSASASCTAGRPPGRGPRRAGDGGRDAPRDGDGVLAAGGRAGAGGGESVARTARSLSLTLSGVDRRRAGGYACD